ncbi:hypothetical protein EZV62_008060 [Acer yangbiense]|uniref:DUF4283 domain-containing protein n=1 Tax=Acer yangbiense TaxID=1000413 RepID=A0A5C7ICN9_9ROSI|nr:hypothetical protein EZV62_008060 [Acer yangbiense]
MNPDEISRLCAELSIHGTEEKLWSVQDTVTKATEKKLDLCLVGKLLSPKHVNRETFRAVILRIWQTTVDIEMVQDNMYLFYFRNPGDRFRVLAGGPWSFDNCLIVLEKLKGVGDIARLPFDRVVFWIQIINAPLICMTKEMGEYIGSCVEELVDIDMGVTGECFGKYMRLRVAIDISKPLKRFLRLELKQVVESMLLIRYEKLIEYYFHCGVIGHSYQFCQARKENNRFVSGMDFAYGLWLKATGVPGAGSGKKQRSNIAFDQESIKISEHHLEIVFLIETICDHKVMKGIRIKLGFDSKLVVDREGNSEGLCLLWNSVVDDVTLFVTYSQDMRNQLLFSNAMLPVDGIFEWVVNFLANFRDARCVEQSVRNDPARVVCWKPPAAACWSQNLISFVDGTKPCPAKFNIDSFGKDTTEIDPAYTEWQQKDQLILSWINASLTPSVLSTVALLSTSHAAWKSLEKRYASQSKTRILQLKNQLHNTKRGDLSISDFSDKITHIVDNLALTGKPDDMMILLL